MAAVLTIAGLALVAVVLRDVFHSLFHPAGTGALSRLIMRLVWALGRRAARWWSGARAIAGPLSVVLTLVVWAALLGVGWALVYWPRLPADVRLASALSPAATSGFGDALYLSFVSLTTLGYGDITPTSAILRVATAAEAVIGFALLTAGITWIAMIQPVLQQRRALALQCDLHQRADERSGVALPDLEPGAASRALDVLAAQVTMAHAGLTQTSVAYYFHDAGDLATLPDALPWLLSLADRGRSAPDARLRHSGAALRAALDEYATLLRDNFLPDAPDDTPAILARYASDHGRA